MICGIIEASTTRTPSDRGRGLAIDHRHLVVTHLTGPARVERGLGVVAHKTHPARHRSGILFPD